MSIPENLPRDVRPLRLPDARIIQLARRTVYFPYDRTSNSGRYYKTDVRAALSHALAIERERETQAQQHEVEVAALRAEIATLAAQLDARTAAETGRVTDAGAQPDTANESSAEVDDDSITPDTGATR